MNIKEKFRTDRLSHAYLLVSSSDKLRNSCAVWLSKAMVCSSEGCKPCGACRACHKTDSGIHPDVITVRRQDDGSGGIRREIYVDQIRFLIADAPIMPNEAKRKVYIIQDAHTMNVSAQNTILKAIEDPPASVSFILCGDKPDSMLPTVLSRCVIVDCGYEDENFDEEAEVLAGEYLSIIISGSRSALLRFCSKNETMPQMQAIEFTSAVYRLLAQRLTDGNAASAALERENVLRLLNRIKKAEGYLKLNVSSKHIFGMLSTVI